MVFYFDRKHKPIELKNYVYIRLTLKMGPFRIIRRVGNLAYELDLPPNLHIHPVISVVYLEQAPDDPWNRQTSTTIPEEVHKLSLPFEVEEIREKKLLPIRKGSKRRIYISTTSGGLVRRKTDNGPHSRRYTANGRTEYNRRRSRAGNHLAPQRNH
jgi:hypothetical protein